MDKEKIFKLKQLNNLGTKDKIADFVGKGFRKLDENLIESKPPKIKWGKIYEQSTDKQKIEYLEKLAATMNHAAYLIQEERNQMLELVAKKEEQIIKLKEAMGKNMDMLTSEITKMNEQRQEFHKEVARLNKRIRELEKKE